MALSLESPRFSLRTAAFADIEMTLTELGHVVLYDAWNPQYLERVQAGAKARFEADDARMNGRFDQFPKEVVEMYLGGLTTLEQVAAITERNFATLDQEFYSEFERTGLPALLRHLLRGHFVLDRSERVVRRTDPRYPVRFAGLHYDGQLHSCARRGLNSQREFTLWTPLVPCVDDQTPRLLLLHRNDAVEFAPKEIGGFDPIQLKPRQVRDEGQYLAKVGSLDEQFERIYREHRCYAPPVPLGSALLFEHCILHGSYRTSKMTTPRYSLDCRAIGEYRPGRETAPFKGMIFRTGIYPVPTLGQRLYRFMRSQAGKAKRALAPQTADTETQSVPVREH